MVYFLMNVSKLTKVKIKDIWKTEDRDFTPWLVENIARLNEDLGFNDDERLYYPARQILSHLNINQIIITYLILLSAWMILLELDFLQENIL